MQAPHIFASQYCIWITPGITYFVWLPLAKVLPLVSMNLIEVYARVLPTAGIVSDYPIHSSSYAVSIETYTYHKSPPAIALAFC